MHLLRFVRGSHPPLRRCAIPGATRHPPLLRRFGPWLAALVLAFVSPANAQSATVAPEPPCGLITQWSLSPPFRPPAFAAENFPDAQVWSKVAWTAVQSATSGVVDIVQQVKTRPAGATRIWARTTLHAAQKEIRPIEFGFSEGLSIFLNGQIIFRGRNTPRPPDATPPAAPDWNNTVYLPLDAGDNELALAVSASPDGWRFMCRDLNVVYLAPHLSQLWEIAGQLPAPESVAYDARRDLFYVSNFNGGSIAKIRADGTLLSLAWVDGLKSPTGLKLHGHKLYATERTGVAVIDVETGQVATRLALADAKFPNDLAFDDRGALYVTDSATNRIFRLIDGQTEVWLQDDALKKPNGIHVDHGRLLVAVDSDGTLKAIDLATRTISTLVTLGVSAYLDGLTGDGRGGYLFSDYYGRIYHLTSTGTRTLLLDRRGPKKFCADFVFVPETGLLVVPSLYDDRLTAYRLKLTSKGIGAE